METSLGKITSAEFRVIPDYPFLIGLRLVFEGNGWGVADGGRYTINLNPEAWKGELIERNECLVKQIEFIAELLKKAKVTSVSGLIGKPVEVTFENRTFKSFRILEEVL